MCSRVTKRSGKASRHGNCVYETNAMGEVLQPMFIFDSGAEMKTTFESS
jgi:hypothetical protein